MALFQKSAPGKKAATSKAAKRAALKPVVKNTFAKKVSRHQAVPRVSMVTAGGYTVFGSPVQPAHRTTRQIAEAIAELD